jgi:hypothetical protein
MKIAFFQRAMYSIIRSAGTSTSSRPFGGSAISDAIEQNPPSGIIRTLNQVSFPLIVNRRGPKPIENS